MAGGIVQRAHGGSGWSEPVHSGDEFHVVIVHVRHSIASRQPGPLGRDICRRGEPSLRAQGVSTASLFWLQGYSGPRDGTVDAVRCVLVLLGCLYFVGPWYAFDIGLLVTFSCRQWQPVPYLTFLLAYTIQSSCTTTVCLFCRILRVLCGRFGPRPSLRVSLACCRGPATRCSNDLSRSAYLCRSEPRCAHTPCYPPAGQTTEGSSGGTLSALSRDVHVRHAGKPRARSGDPSHPPSDLQDSPRVHLRRQVNSRRACHGRDRVGACDCAFLVAWIMCVLCLYRIAL